jgi:hypothetical protein
MLGLSTPPARPGVEYRQFAVCAAPRRVDEIPRNGVHNIFVEDPNGMNIELFERAAPPQ